MAGPSTSWQGSLRDFMQDRAKDARELTDLQRLGDRALDWFSSARTHLGDYVDGARDRPWIQQLNRSLGGNWILPLLDRVNIQRVRETVAAAQKQHPNDAPGQLADRLIQRKAFFAGGIGVASGVLPPGLNLPMVAVDVVATVVMEIELVYEIAHVYGLDLDSPDRKGEAILVLALGTGADRLAGLSAVALKRLARDQLSRAAIEQLARIIGKQLAERVVLRGLPLFVGAVIGGGANLTALNLIGNAARRFYEHEITVQATPLDDTAQPLELPD